MSFAWILFIVIGIIAAVVLINGGETRDDGDQHNWTTSLDS